jgi:hypothetical protein
MTSFLSDPQITFNNVVIFQNEDAYGTDLTPGMIKYDSTADEFQGYHNSEDVDGNNWRPLTQNIATGDSVGVFKVGSNLLMNESTGYLSSISSGGTRLKQLVITVSPQSEGGDYTSINDAISNVIGTVGGGYRDGSLTQSSNLDAAPNLSNSFIVLVSPGIYTESSQIVLPNYVSLRGEGKNQVIIQKTSSANESLADSAIIKSGSNSSITNITVRMNPNGKTNICGIYASSNSDVTINNVIVEDIGSSGATNNCFGVYIQSGSNLIINNYETKFSLDSSNIYGIYTHNNKPDINNSKITIEANANTNNYGIYMSNSNLIEDRSIINNNFISVSGGTTNYGAYLGNSSARLQYNNIEAIDETSGRTSYGIALTGESSTAKIISTVISFTHSDSVKDTIISSDSSVVNFITLGFTRGQAIKILGASNSINNGYFTIFNVESTTITLIEQDILATESAGQTITLQELFLVNMSYNHINGTTNSIKSLDSNGSFQVENNYCILEGGQPDLGSDNILFTHNHLITVAPIGGDYTLVSSALESILQNTSKNRYLIRVMSGEYIETSAFAAKEYVTIVGSGKENTIIVFDNKNSTLSDGGGITLASNISLMDMTIKNLTTGAFSESSVVLYGEGTSSSNKMKNVNLFNLDLVSNGVATTQYGIYMKYCNYTSDNVGIDLTGSSSSSSNNYGWYHEESGYNNRGTDIQIRGGLNATKNIGLDLKKSDVNIFASNISVQGSSNANYGVETIEETTTYNVAQFFGGKIETLGSGTNYSFLNGSTVTRYLAILNGIYLVGDSEDNSDDGRKLVCHNSYQIGSNNTYKPLNIRGQSDENTNSSLSIGYTAGKIDMIGEFNTMIGVNSGKNITTGDGDTFIGYNSGNSLTTGNNNTFVGHNAGSSATTADNNIGIGSNAAFNLVSGTNNIHIGRGSGYNNVSGTDNVTIGSNTAQDLTSGLRNIVMGYKSGKSLTTANDNVMVGAYSGFNVTTGGNSTIIGQSAGYSLTTGSNVIAIGDNAGYNNTASENLMIGSYGGYNVTTGLNNFMMGFKAGFKTTTGSRGIYIGNKAAYSATIAVNNIVIGSEAGYSMTSGSKNILIGSKTSDTVDTQDAAGWSLTTGNLNVAIGSGSGRAMTTSINNILIGVDSGKSITTGSDNILIGRLTGLTNLTTQNQNIFIGSCSGVNATSSNNLFIGNNSGAGSSGNEMIAIGNLSGKNISGPRNMFVGYQAGGISTTTTGSDNILFGIHTGYYISSGSRNTVFGAGDTSRSAGRQLTTGSDNTIMGYRAGGSIRSANENVFIGSNAGGLTTSSKNISIGTEAGESGLGVVEGSDRVGGNINIGYQSGKAQTSAIYNLNIGYQSGIINQEGDYNVNIGYQAGYSGLTNDNNIHIGYQSGYSSLASDNIMVGYQSGYSTNSADAINNVLIGYKSGYGITTGANNMFLGSNAGMNITTGVKNVMIGNDAGKGTGSYAVSRTILIGPNAGLNNLGSNSVYIGSSTDDNKGIGYQATTNAIKNVIIGIDSGLEITDGEKNTGVGVNCLTSLTTGSNNTGIGINSGRNLTTGSNNIVIGNETGKTLTTGTQNLIIGDLAGAAIGGSVSDGILIGENAGQYVQTSNIIAIGTNAGKNNSTGANNFYIGRDAGKLNTTSSDNLIIGSEAGSSLQSGDGKNVFIGSQAGLFNQTGYNNLAIGKNTIRAGTTTSNTIAIGNEACRNVTTGLNNIGIGIESLNTVTTGDNNVCMGYQTGKNLNTSNCILIGTNTGTDITTGENNIGFGIEALRNTTTGENNVAVGYRTLKFNTIGSNNIAMSYQALEYNLERNNNLAIGVNAGRYFGQTNTNANADGGNMFYGFHAGLYNNGSYNIFMGNESGQGLTNSATPALNTANNNIGIGAFSLREITIGSNNIVVGTTCAMNVTTGSNNIVIGSNTGTAITTGSDNIMMGSFSGQGESTGNKNIHIGFRSGLKTDITSNQAYLTDGTPYYDGPASNYNISIGDESMNTSYLAGNNYLENNVVIGRKTMSNIQDIYVGGLNSNIIIGNTVIGANAGLQTSGSYNVIAGYQAGYNCGGNNNVYIGPSSGHNNSYGSNNIFLGIVSDGTYTLDADISPPLSNIFAVYTDNGLVSGNAPLLFGDLVDNILVVNERTTSSPSTSDATTRLFVNGGVEAQSYTPFTGVHIVKLVNEIIQPEEGQIMVSRGVVTKKDLLNTIVSVEISNKIKDKKVYGVYSGFEIRNDKYKTNTNQVISSHRVDKVAAVGEGTMLVTNIGGNIMNGEYICSSDIPGYGMLQNDDIVHNYTVAKSTEDVDWSNISNVVVWHDIEYKKYRICCTYHCG